MITSFTKAAATEIANKKSRDTGLPIEVIDKNVGTMHSICYHALGAPQIMEVDFIKEWNNAHPQLAITGQKNSTIGMDYAADDSQIPTEFGNGLLSAMNIYRNKMLNPQMWPGPIKQFKRKWDSFKNGVGAVDFTDLIENSITDLPYAPGHPEVLFIDEAQDFTRLQLKLARNWGMEMKWIVLVGDDDQTIYKFTGADPYAFLLPAVPDNRKTVLNQSYRVPQAVLERSMDLIEKIETREPKKYMARKNEDGTTAIGEANDRDFTYNKPEEMITEVADYANNGKKVMILTSCSFMLEASKAILRDRGIPFANPYRTSRADWNPLSSRSNGVSAKDLLVNFKSSGSDDPYWNVPQFVNWAQFIKTGPEGLIRGAGKKAIKLLKKAIENNETGLHTTRNVITQIMSQNAIIPALNRDMEWFQDNLVKSRLTSIIYPMSVLNNFGLNAIIEPPKVTIGTIHSVKGAEADVVYLFPDISWQAVKEYESDTGKDSIHRVFYVGMTRTKEILNIGEAATKSQYKENKPSVEI
jgi:superfamily I DNA/RNA helicase